MDCNTPGFPVLHHLPELATQSKVMKDKIRKETSELAEAKRERTLEICKKLPSRIHLSSDKNMEVRKLLNTR